MSQGRILVIRGGAIGDFVLTLPAIAALRQRFPSAHLEVLGYPHIAQLAIAGRYVDRVRAIEARGLAGFFARYGSLDPGIAHYFSEFDLILSYLYDPDGIFAGNLAACTDAQVIHGAHRPDEAIPLHATEVYLKPLERLAIFDGDPVPRLDLGVRAGDRVILALHPGSGSDRKNWPEARWADLIQRILEATDLTLLMVGGEAEVDRLDRLGAGVPEHRLTVARSLPLTEVAERLGRCRAFVGHDSGVTHIAAAVGLPCLVLWPGTNEVVWKPRGDRVSLLKEPRGLRVLDVEVVVRETLRLML